MLLLGLILAVVLLAGRQPQVVVSGSDTVARQVAPAALAAAAAAADYDRAFIARLQSAERPTVVMKPGKVGAMPAARGTSRIGGDPDLPAGARWPTCHGRPQSFLAQVRVRKLPRELRRAGGLLLFFTAIEPDKSWAGDCSAVVHARAGTRLVRRSARGQRLRAAPLRFTVHQDIPSSKLDSSYLTPPLQDVLGGDRYDSLREALGADTMVSHRLLGYGEPPNGGDACWSRAGRASRPRRHLFTLNSDEDVGFEIADAGRIQLLISPDDLRAGRFDRLCGVFDS